MESINGDAKEAEKMDQLIDEIVDYRFELLTKVSNYPIHGKRAQVKKHFNSIKEELKAQNKGYSKKIGHVQ